MNWQTVASMLILVLGAAAIAGYCWMVASSSAADQEPEPRTFTFPDGLTADDREWVRRQMDIAGKHPTYTYQLAEAFVKAKKTGLVIPETLAAEVTARLNAEPAFTYLCREEEG